MNDSRKMHISDFAAAGCPDTQCDTAGNSREVARVAQPVDREQSETALERMERYTAHLEGLVLQKNEEMRSLQRIMALHVKEEIQKATMNEHIMIQQAHQAAMSELLDIAAHHWRQPLNVIALVVQNLKHAWDSGEFDDELLDRSVSQAMEQINLMSRFIDDFRTLLNSSDPDSALFGIRLPAVPTERSCA